MGMPKKWCLYKHVNKTNGKIYIGITSLPTYRRWDNGRGYKGNRYFYNSICKHGWNGFDHEILMKDLTREKACECEKNLIKKLESNNREKGYNIANGGEGVGSVSEESKEKMSVHMFGNTNMKGYKFSKESKEKMSIAKKGVKLSEAHKKKIAENCNCSTEVVARRTAHSKGNHYKLGFKESEETKKKKSERMKTCQFGSNNNFARSVRCLNNGKTFGSVVEAGAYCGLKNVGRISDVCKGYRKNAGKLDGKLLKWAYC